MTVARLELCRQLYEISGWSDEQIHTWRLHLLNGASELVLTRDQALDNFRFRNSPEAPRFRKENKFYPAYDAGFLLRKLPKRSERIEDTAMLGRATGNKGWSVVYREFVKIADTPEDALCQLAIELFNQDVLKRDKE